MIDKIVLSGLLLLILVVLPSFTTTDIGDQDIPNDKFIVVLDAGHGGHDPGNRGNGYKEKEIALKVVLAVGKALEKDGRFEVIYTRKSDKFVELFERGKIANKAKADLFVSVHCNSHKSQAQGAETFVLGLHANNKNFEIAKNENSVILLEDNYEQNYDGFDPNSPESIIGLTLLQEEYLDQSLNLASYVQNQFTNRLKRKNRGVKQAGFIVLHQTYMPSVLIELGFLTNDKEGRYLNSTKGQDDMATSITKSVIDYKESLDANYFIAKPKVVEAPNPTLIAESEVNKPTIEILDKTGGEVYEGVVFKVQIAAGPTDIPLEAKNFKGLDQLSKTRYGKVYKYFYGNTSNYTVIRQLRDIAITKGFDASFVVAFQKNELIPLAEVLKDSDSSN